MKGRTQSIGVSAAGVILPARKDVAYLVKDIFIVYTSTGTTRLVYFFGPAYDYVDRYGRGSIVHSTVVVGAGTASTTPPYNSFLFDPNLFLGNPDEAFGVWTSIALTFLAGSYIRFEEVYS